MRHKKPTEAEKVGRVIRRAADVLQDREWTQGTDLRSTTDGVHHMCTRGAIHFSVLGLNMVSAPFDTRKTRMNPQVKLVIDSVQAFSSWLNENGLGRDTVIWNDTKGRTKEEVIQYLRKFADEKDPKKI